MSTNLSVIESIYDKRAPAYDTADHPCHRRQAADYIKCMDLQSGMTILDLACGTGGVTLPAKRAVGAEGKVIGIDISSASLSIAKEKAKKEDLDITFIHHDINALDTVPEVAVEEFDRISCAAAFVLLEDPDEAVKKWTKLLKPNGRLIFDVPTKDTMFGGLFVLEEVSTELGLHMWFSRMRQASVETVKVILSNAGLNPSKSFMSESYEENEIRVENAGYIFDGIVGKKSWLAELYKPLEDPTVRQVAKERFIEKLRERADGNGVVKEQLRFCMAIGEKV
jgi:ubiquinone/menaquinone biosynthesis C-methylase UbiE